MEFPVFHPDLDPLEGGRRCAKRIRSGSYRLNPVNRDAVPDDSRTNENIRFFDGIVAGKQQNTEENAVEDSGYDQNQSFSPVILPRKGTLDD